MTSPDARPAHLSSPPPSSPSSPSLPPSSLPSSRPSADQGNIPPLVQDIPSSSPSTPTPGVSQGAHSPSDDILRNSPSNQQFASTSPSQNTLSYVHSANSPDATDPTSLGKNDMPHIHSSSASPETIRRAPTHRRSYLDMDDDDDSQRQSPSRGVFDSLRRLIAPISPESTSKKGSNNGSSDTAPPNEDNATTSRSHPPIVDVDIPRTSTSSGTALLPSFIPRSSPAAPNPQQFPSLFNFPFKAASPSPSFPQLSGDSPARGSRLSLEAVPDTPTPAPRHSQMQSSELSLSTADTTVRPIITPRRLSNPSSIALAQAHASMSDEALHTESVIERRRPLPIGESPLIFGGIAPRRITKSVPLQPTLLSEESSPPKIGPPPPTAASTSDITPVIAGPGSSTPKPGIIRDDRMGSVRNSPPKSVTYEDEVFGDSSKDSRGLGKRKSEDVDRLELEGSGSRASGSAVVVDEEGRVERKRRHHHSKGPTDASAASAPSPRRGMSKRIKLAANQFDPDPRSSGDGARAGRSSATKPPIPPRHSRTARPASAQSESASIARPASARSRPKSATFSIRTGTSARSIPLSAIVSPRPPGTGFSMGEYTMGFSGGREEGVYMRHPDPRRGGWGRVSWRVKYRKPKRAGTEKEPSDYLDEGEVTPLPGRLFYPAFLFPLLWFIGSLLRGPAHVEAPSQTEPKWDQRAWEESRVQARVFKTWRDRCRLMALVSLITYLPVIVLLAIFVPR